MVEEVIKWAVRWEQVFVGVGKRRKGRVSSDRRLSPYGRSRTLALSLCKVSRERDWLMEKR